MKDEANVSLVYAHAKSYGRNDDVYSLVSASGVKGYVWREHLQ